jgi:hypothetical protein
MGGSRVGAFGEQLVLLARDARCLDHRGKIAIALTLPGLINPDATCTTDDGTRSRVPEAIASRRTSRAKSRSMQS